MSQSSLFASSPLIIIVIVNGYRQYYRHHSHHQHQQHRHRHHRSRDVLDHLRRYLQSMIVKIGTDVYRDHTCIKLNLCRTMQSGGYFGGVGWVNCAF